MLKFEQFSLYADLEKTETMTSRHAIVFPVLNLCTLVTVTFALCNRAIEWFNLTCVLMSVYDFVLFRSRVQP